MPWFKKKPIPVEARQFTAAAALPVADWCLGHLAYQENEAVYLIVPTLEGPMKANLGDWIIRGVQGEFYPCKESIFKETYDQVGS